MTLSAASGQSVSVNFATANNTAKATSDFSATSGQLIFNAGETSKIITVFINGDTVREIHEAFFVNLSRAKNATIIDSRGIGQILNDDEI